MWGEHCLCGDPYCSRCFPFEARERKAMDGAIVAGTKVCCDRCSKVWDRGSRSYTRWRGDVLCRVRHTFNDYRICLLEAFEEARVRETARSSAAARV